MLRANRTQEQTKTILHAYTLLRNITCKPNEATCFSKIGDSNLIMVVSC